MFLILSIALLILCDNVFSLVLCEFCMVGLNICCTSILHTAYWMCFSLPDAEITYLQSFSIFNAKGLRQSVSLHCHSQARIKEDYVCLFSTGDFFFSHSLLGS